MNTYMHTHTHTHIHIHTYTRTHTYIHTISIYILHTHTHTHTHTQHTHAHTHTHTHLNILLKKKKVEPVVSQLLTENSNLAQRKQDSLKAFGQFMKNPATQFSSTSQALASATMGKALKKRNVFFIA